MARAKTARPAKQYPAHPSTADGRSLTCGIDRNRDGTIVIGWYQVHAQFPTGTPLTIKTGAYQQRAFGKGDTAVAAARAYAAKHFEGALDRVK